MMSLITLTCKLLFLAKPIFRHAIFGSDLLVVPYIFCFFLFLGGLLFLACLLLAVLLLASVGAMQHDMWQQLRTPCGMTCGIIISSLY
jgi:hypothetical protein